jgi:V/A-type H+/Na+-transporting ATPase subunit D
VRHPQDAVVRFDDDGSEAAAPATTALIMAAAAHRAALAAAACHAVADETARRIDAEVAATRRRWRAVRDRWIPYLQEALHRAELDLEELEHAEGVRVRWVAGLGRGTERDR